MTTRRRSGWLAAVLALFGVGLAGWGFYAAANPSVVVRWSTATEFETAGYAVHRSESPDGPFETVSDTLIPAASDPLSGGDYEFVDRKVVPGTTYYYLLEEIELSGQTNREGPVVVEASRRGIVEMLVGALLVLASAVVFRWTPGGGSRDSA